MPLPGAFLPLAVALQLAASPGAPAPLPGAPATRPEQVRAYLAARDAYVRQLAGKRDLTSDASEDRALADLEKRLRALVGTVRLAGLSGEGKVNLETLRDGDHPGFGRVDGLRFAWGDDGLFVTTRPLLDAYLAADRTLPAKLDAIWSTPAAFADFFGRVFTSEAAFEWFGEVPVRAPGDLALAALAFPTQEWIPVPPTTLLVVVARGDRVLIATSLVAQLEQLPACEAEWRAGAEKATAARAAGGSERDQWRLEQDAFDAYRRCYARTFRDRPAFADLTRRAQAIAYALATSGVDGP